MGQLTHTPARRTARQTPRRPPRVCRVRPIIARTMDSRIPRASGRAIPHQPVELAVSTAPWSFLDYPAGNPKLVSRSSKAAPGVNVGRTRQGTSSSNLPPLAKQWQNSGKTKALTEAPGLLYAHARA